ncbi:flagellar biosynthesis protein FlgN [Rhodobacteraceae bacterium F11138]|nr:flagellar biosynthesis protein FlgN [Rhodobacteraceae bacterium F11138]
MTHETPQDLINALDSLLDREKHALLKGDVEQVGKLLHTKEQLIDQINILQTAEQLQLAAVQEKVTRNQALLNSALDGIRAVADRMADLRKVRGGLETYDQRGQKQKFGTQSFSSVEKRA